MIQLIKLYFYISLQLNTHDHYETHKTTPRCTNARRSKDKECSVLYEKTINLLTKFSKGTPEVIYANPKQLQLTVNEKAQWRNSTNNVKPIKL